MRKNLGAKPYTYPQPVFILAAYDERGKTDAMNAAWGGISDGDELSMCISAGHKTTKNLLNRKAFTVSMADVKNVVACDYVGIVSGNTEPNKFEKSGFHAVKSEFVDAPVIEELPIAVECRLRSYDPASGRLVGEIVNVSVDERMLDANGKEFIMRGINHAHRSMLKRFSQSPLTLSTIPMSHSAKSWEQRSATAKN